MRYIWGKGIRRDKMHIQFHDAMGIGYNATLCGIVVGDGCRTINPPFALGRKVCKHCLAIANGHRHAVDRRAAERNSTTESRKNRGKPTDGCAA